MTSSDNLIGSKNKFGKIPIIITDNANGIKIRTNNSARNPDGGEFLFWAFAEAPIKYANAR